jgi:FMN phosphatase YigB (HAD superfamily)
MIRAIILDCFGVFYTDPVFAYMRDPRTSPQKAEALHSLDEQAAHGVLSKAAFIEQAAVLLNRLPEKVEEQFFRSFGRNQALMDFTQRVRTKYKTALLSNIGSDMMEGYFTAQERKALFDVVILSGEVKMAKPDPEIFKLTLGRLGVTPAEAIFIDDSANHVQGAEKVGIRSIQFVSNGQLKNELLNLGLDRESVNIL